MPAMGGEGAGIKGFIETSLLDWPGRVSAVVFVGGCNLRCPFCHNPELVLSPGRVKDVDPLVVAESLKAHDGWLDGVVVTGGEPTISPGIEALLEFVRGMGLDSRPMIKLDTNGTRPDVLERLVSRGLVDAVAMDVKAPLSPGEYSKAAGVEVDVDAVKTSVRFLAESPLEVTFRCTVVPGLHDAEAVKSIAGRLFGRGLALQNFRPGSALDPAFNGITPFSKSEFAALVEAAGGASVAGAMEATGARGPDAIETSPCHSR